MLPKKNRADKKLVEEIWKDGSFVAAQNISLKYFQKKSDTPPRISFIVPKKIESGAVGRNYLKRRGYLALEKYFDRFPKGFSGVFIFNKHFNSVAEIENEIKKILDKIN